MVEMIRRHNRKQILWIPVHLVFGSLGYSLCWWFFHTAGEMLFENLEFLIPPSLWQAREGVVFAVALLGTAAGTFEGWRLRCEDRTELPGPLGAVVPHSTWGPGAGSSRFDMAVWAVEFRLLLNVVLSGPIQFLSAWRRVTNFIPDTPENRTRLEPWLRFAASQSGWHSESLYSDDDTALGWLVQMDFLEHSPTKALVKMREGGDWFWSRQPSVTLDESVSGH